MQRLLPYLGYRTGSCDHLFEKVQFEGTHLSPTTPRRCTPLRS